MGNQCCASSTNTESNNTETCVVDNYATQLQISSGYVKRLKCKILTDTIHAKFNSIHGDYYCQVFGKKKLFVEAYPMEKKSDCHEALENFVKDYGAPESMIYNGSQEQVGPGTEFQANLIK